MQEAKLEITHNTLEHTGYLSLLFAEHRQEMTRQLHDVRLGDTDLLHQPNDGRHHSFISHHVS